MSRPSLALALTVLLAISAVAVVGAVSDESASATTPFAQPSPGEPNYLTIADDEVRESNVTRLDLDVGSAIAADSAALQATHTGLRFENVYVDTTSPENRTRAIRSIVERLANETRILQANSRAGIESFGTGETSAAGFVRERARIDTRAGELRTTVSTIQSRIDLDPTYSLPSDVAGRLDSLGGTLEALRGPISGSTAQQLASGGESPWTYAAVSDSGYTLAQVNNGLYVRETFLGAEWVQGGPDRFARNATNRVNAAEDRAMELYPWVRQNHGGGSAFGLGSDIYRVRRTLPNGELTVYLDGSTTNVFRETQTRTVTSFNKTQVENRTEASVRLTVNRTFATGPAEITLRNATSGDPLNGTVTVGNRAPVSLGEDGSLWIVEPRDGVTINATAGSAEFTARLPGS